MSTHVFKRFGRKPSKNPAEFNKDLVRGENAQKEFRKVFPANLSTPDTRDYDFVLPTSESLELKTDFHKTKNFYFERYSSIETGTPGGVWQSAGKQVDYFCYWFKIKGYYYLFDTKDLLLFLTEYVALNNPKLIPVPNKRYNGDVYITQGYLIPESVIRNSDLCLQIAPEHLVEKSNTIPNAINK